MAVSSFSRFSAVLRPAAVSAAVLIQTQRYKGRLDAAKDATRRPDNDDTGQMNGDRAHGASQGFRRALIAAEIGINNTVMSRPNFGIGEYMSNVSPLFGHGSLINVLRSGLEFLSVFNCMQKLTE